MDSSSAPLMMVDILCNEFYSPSERKVVNLGHSGVVAVGEDGATVVGSSHGWLALFNERTLDLFLWNPISDERVNLPSIRKLPIPEENLEGGYGCVDRVIVSSPSFVGGEWRAVMSYGTAASLAFCCPRESSSEWTTIGGRTVYYNGRKLTEYGYENFAYSCRLDRFLCVASYGEILERWDLRDPLSPRIDCSNEEEREREREREREEEREEEEEEEEHEEYEELRYIVVAEQSNEVFVVVRSSISGKGAVGSNLRKWPYKSCDEEDNDRGFDFKTIDFDVYKIVMDGTKMSESYIEGGSLNGLAMFVGINHSIALPAADYHGLNSDSIYFTDGTFGLHPTCTSITKYGYGGNEVGIFDYKNKTFHPCYFPNYHVDIITKVTPQPVWFTPTTSEITSSKII